MTGQMERDLAQHFNDKLRQLICDTVDNFDRGNISDEAAVNIVMGLGKHMATIILCCGGKEDAFVQVIRRCFSIVQENERKAAAESQ